MQAIRVWLSAVVALFLVVSMFHVPLIQMWKRQKASAVPVSTAPAPVTEAEPVVSLAEGDNGAKEAEVAQPEATESTVASEPSEPSEASEGGVATGDARVVKIGMYSNMHFSVGRFVAQTGERLTVEFENDDPQALFRLRRQTT